MSELVWVEPVTRPDCDLVTVSPMVAPFNAHVRPVVSPLAFLPIAPALVFPYTAPVTSPVPASKVVSVGNAPSRVMVFTAPASV
ncbi:hypothetical protein EH165_14695 [Nakamurella antarctica]|uniref:Uncharacterized protein n=1 Tax=Nakamurella antarctica TaxID=1902245 RepID=A0A3G8ZPC9_9ACTN|nr:hypothetical protein [Nakamurella antarctica]AZI59202.1 hypothetical protein EH165_14695 [Nakamurella antarctica]